MQGLELSRRFYFEAVRPILESRFPDLEHAAALIGTGSEVLGFDDETSRDHEWGPRVQLFVSDHARADVLERTFADELPVSFAGFPTHFGPTDEEGTRVLTTVDSGPVVHRVETFVFDKWIREFVGVNPLGGFSARDWLATPTQRLLEVTGGAVFADPVGELTRVRELLAWYPHDVWLFVMAGHWQRIAEFEHLHGRAGLRGDELGSRILAAALVRDLMRIGMLQRRCYPPYPKWLGSAYAALELPETPALEAALRADDWGSRENALVEAYEAVARRHNELGVTEPVDPRVRAFWGRPIQVLFAERFADALRDAVSGPEVRAVEHRAGAVDAISDNTIFLTQPRLWRRLVDLY